MYKNAPIQQVDNTTFLGVIIDDDLNWSNHTSYNNSKIAKEIGVICRARKFFSKTALIDLYYAFIFPYLIYCVEVWDNAVSTHTQPSIKLQNKIIRIITCSHFLASSEKIYAETGILFYNTRQVHHIHSFKGNNEFIYITFKFHSVYVWNSILQNLNINVYFPTFKHLLKRFQLNINTSVRYDK